MKRRAFMSRLGIGTIAVGSLGHGNSLSALDKDSLGLGTQGVGSGSVSESLSRKSLGSINLLDFERGSNDYSKAFELGLAAASESGKALYIPGGHYPLRNPISHRGDVYVIAGGFVTLEWSDKNEADSLIEINGRLEWVAGHTVINGNDLVYVGICAPTHLPRIENVHFKRISAVALLAGRRFDKKNKRYHGQNGLGAGFLLNCSAEKCGSLSVVAGKGDESKSSFGLIDCQTDWRSGTFTNIFNLASLGYGYVRGGWYRGVERTSPNMTRTRRCEYIGGVYENMLRGPTVGDSARNVVMVGGVSENMKYAGISLDARRADRVVPWVSGKVDWTVIGEPRFGVFCQASGVEINLFHVLNGGADPRKCTVRLTDAVGVSLGRICAKRAGSASLIRLGSGDAPRPGSIAYKTGDWSTDSETQDAISMSRESQLIFERARVVSADSKVRLVDETIVIDASRRRVRLVFPELYARNAVGKMWRVIVANNDHDISIVEEGTGFKSGVRARSFLSAKNFEGSHFFVISRGDGSYSISRG